MVRSWRWNGKSIVAAGSWQSPKARSCSISRWSTPRGGRWPTASSSGSARSPGGSPSLKDNSTWRLGGPTHAYRPGREDQDLPLGCSPPGTFRPAGLSGPGPAFGPPKPGCPVRCRPPRRSRRGRGSPARAQPRRGHRQGPAGNLPPLAVSPDVPGGRPTARDDRTTKYTKKNNELTSARNHRSRCWIEPAASSLVGSAELHLFRVFRVFRGSWHGFRGSLQGPHFLLEHLLHPVLGDEDVGDLHAQLPGHLGPGTISLCLGWPDRSRDVSPYFLGH